MKTVRYMNTKVLGVISSGMEHGLPFIADFKRTRDGYNGTKYT